MPPDPPSSSRFKHLKGAWRHLKYVMSGVNVQCFHEHVRYLTKLLKSLFWEDDFHYWKNGLFGDYKWATSVETLGIKICLGLIFSPSPQTNVDFSISLTAQTTPSQHWIGGQGVSEN